MVQVSYPGVYIQEVPSGVRTISGVSTSIAAFLGRASKGPIDKPVRLLSYADYERKFGEAHQQSDLAQSVKMFFGNGGTDCYVVRLAPGAGTASVNLQNLNGDETLVATAKAAGEWGNTIRLEVNYNTTNPDSTFNLNVYYEDSGSVVQSESFIGLSMDPQSARFAPSFVTQSSELISLAIAAGIGDPEDTTSIYYTAGTASGFSRAMRPLRNPLTSVSGATAASDIAAALDSLVAAGQYNFDISVNGSTPVTVDLSAESPFPTSSLAAIRASIESALVTALSSLSPVPTVSAQISNAIAGFGRLLSLTSTTGVSGMGTSIRVTRSATNDIAAALMLGVDQGGVEVVRWSNYRPAPTASLLRIGATATPDDVSTLEALLSINQNAITAINVDGTSVVLNSSDYNLVTTAGSDDWYLNTSGASTITGDNDGVREKLRIIANAINAASNLGFRAEVWGYHLAVIATDGAMSNIPSALSTGTVGFDTGITINARQYSLGQNVNNSLSSGSAPGTEGGIPDQTAYLGSEANQTGLHALDALDLVNLLILPGDREVSDTTLATVWGPASVYCKKRRAFLLVDPPLGWTNTNGRPAVVQDTSMVNTLRATMEKDYSAVFYPRVRYSDKGLVKLIGAAGAIAGLMARIDSNRGVWKAPAGIEAGLRGIVGVNVELTDAENGVLNKKAVNCIRVLPNGIVNWGSRTLDGDDDFGSEWKYIPIRRLALMIEESLYRGTRWAVFEPNDEPLWANIRLNVGAFMNSLFRQGAFQGSSPQQAYYVKCDADTTTQNDRNLGIVNIEVGFAPLKPAEFVVIKIQQIAGNIPT